MLQMKWNLMQIDCIVYIKKLMNSYVIITSF